MNTSNLRTLIGNIRSDFIKSNITPEEAMAQLQNIDCDAGVEDTVSKDSLRAVANASIMMAEAKIQ